LGKIFLGDFEGTLPPRLSDCWLDCLVNMNNQPSSTFLAAYIAHLQIIKADVI
jgi:hypothetical protein